MDGAEIAVGLDIAIVVVRREPDQLRSPPTQDI
jgi:hypothetical protein